MKENNENGRLESTRFLSGELGSTRRTLAGNIFLVAGDPFVHFLDGGGSNRTVALPALSSGGDWRILSNVGATNSLLITNANGLAVATIGVGETGLFFGSNAEWAVIRGYATIGDSFGPAGLEHGKGLVPDPGAVAGLHRFLEDDGTWTSVTTAGIVDAYKTVTDGTNSAVASGLTTIRLRSSDSSVSAVVTDNDGVFGDVINFTVDPSHVNHNLLLNYVANQHIDHSAVSFTPSEGVQGGGTIAASRTLKLDFSGLGTATPALTDTIPYFQTATHYKTTWSTINGILDHNALLNFVADKHVAHSGVSMIAGTGLSGGGDISASRTFNLSIGSLATVTSMVAGDLIPFSHSGTMENITFANFNLALDHNVLTNYSANQHVDHTTVSIVAGTGLSGGGTIAASRTLNLTAAAVGTLGGLLSSSAPSHQFATGVNISGVIQYVQPNYTDLAGVLPNPSASSLGGIQSYTAVSHQWINAISTSGVPSGSQPAFSDISGSFTLAQFPTQVDQTVLGNVSGGAAVPIALSKAQLTTLVNLATTSVSGAAPILPNDATKFLNGTGAYSVPAGAGDMLKANNLSDVASAATSRTNLGVTATGTDTTYAFRANNLSDLANATTARTNLGLGTAAVKNTGTSGNTIPLLDGTNTWSGGVQTFTGTEIQVKDGVVTSFIAASSGGGGAYLGTRTNHPTVFRTNDLDRISIASGGSVSVVGALSKGSGTFLIDHPLDPENKDLFHGFVEAPRYDLIYRGKIQLKAGRAVVEIDLASNMSSGTFAALTQNSEVVALNNLSNFARVKCSSIEKGSFTIFCEDPTSSDIIHWVVIGERADAFIKNGFETHVNAGGRMIPEWEKIPEAGGKKSARHWKELGLASPEKKK